MHIFASSKLEFPWSCAMVQAVCRLLLIPEAQVRSQQSPIRDLGFVVNNISLGEELLQAVRVHAFSVIRHRLQTLPLLSPRL